MYSKNIANLEAFCWNNSSSISRFFLKSVRQLKISKYAWCDVHLLPIFPNMKMSQYEIQIKGSILLNVRLQNSHKFIMSLSFCGAHVTRTTNIFNPIERLISLLMRYFPFYFGGGLKIIFASILKCNFNGFFYCMINCVYILQ